MEYLESIQSQYLFVFDAKPIQENQNNILTEHWILTQALENYDTDNSTIA